MSKTVTICVAVALFPLASVTVQVTVVFPIGNVAGALFKTVATVQLSEVKAFPNDAIVAVHPLVNETVSAVGATIVGF